MHQSLYWFGQLSGARVDGVLPVVGFLIAQLFNDGSTTRIFRRQIIEVAFEVLNDLALGLGDEAQAPLITENAAHRTNRVSTGVPEGTEFAWFFAEFLDALLTPRKVIVLLGGRFLHLLFDTRVPGNRGMTLVQGLRRYLAGVIDAHEPGSVGFLTG